jgi:hypothetical protein
MNRKQFIEKFLPNYKKLKENHTIFQLNPMSDEEFEDLYFQEALQNFMDKVCEFQLQEAFTSMEPLHRMILTENSCDLKDLDKLMEMFADEFFDVPKPEIEDVVESLKYT